MAEAAAAVAWILLCLRWFDAAAPLREAYLFSAQHHTGQVRDSGEPYMVHPVQVALILACVALART